MTRLEDFLYTIMDKKGPNQLVHATKKFKCTEPVDVELKLNVSVIRSDTISDHKESTPRSSISGMETVDNGISLEKIDLVTKGQSSGLPEVVHHKPVKANIEQLILDKIPEKNDLLILLSPIAFKWRNIGDALGVPDGNIQIINMDGRLNAVDQLSEVLQIWIDRQPSDVTWQNIIEIVGGPVVQVEYKATDIRKFLEQNHVQKKYMNRKTFAETI